MKVNVTEMKGRAVVLSDVNNNTFRLCPFESKEVDTKIVSNDFYNEQITGGIFMEPIPPKKPKGGKKL
jgi:hypothetical protein